MAPDDLSPRSDLAAPETAPGLAGGTPQGPRQTLAMRLAERNRQRELRAERLARLRPPSPPGASPHATPGALPEAPDPETAAAPGATPASVETAEAALEDFLKALTADLPALPEGPTIEPGALLPFQRPPEVSGHTAGQSGGQTVAQTVAQTGPQAAAETRTALRPASDLDRLPGVGPGLVWALERAGLRRLADLAPLAPAELAARLGPLGRLVPAARWIATARTAAEG